MPRGCVSDWLLDGVCSLGRLGLGRPLLTSGWAAGAGSVRIGSLLWRPVWDPDQGVASRRRILRPSRPSMASPALRHFSHRLSLHLPGRRRFAHRAAVASPTVPPSLRPPGRRRFTYLPVTSPTGPPLHLPGRHFTYRAATSPTGPPLHLPGRHFTHLAAATSHTGPPPLHTPGRHFTHLAAVTSPTCPSLHLPGRHFTHRAATSPTARRLAYRSTVTPPHAPASPSPLFPSSSPSPFGGVLSSVALPNCAWSIDWSGCGGGRLWWPVRGASRAPRRLRRGGDVASRPRSGP
ncbi:hypothetical protein JOD67_001405 [Tenggerimyces flavus]|nr:hypothetical protein [Tenggerimyces flavus]